MQINNELGMSVLQQYTAACCDEGLGAVASVNHTHIKSRDIKKLWQGVFAGSYNSHIYATHSNAAGQTYSSKSSSSDCELGCHENDSLLIKSTSGLLPPESWAWST